MAPQRALFAGAVVAVAAASAVDPSLFNVVFDAPSNGPGRTQGGRLTYADAMPLGNGALTATAWANTTAGGVGVYIGSQLAMSSWGELFKTGQLWVTLSPNPFEAGPYFKQELDLPSASVLVYAGGSSMADYGVLLRVWADANTDTLFVSATAREPTNTFALQVTVTSTRPAHVWEYTPPFASCSPVSSQPDVFVDPLPGPTKLAPLPPQTREDAIRYATGNKRPQRAFPAKGVALPATASFQPGSVIVYHRNEASDGNSLASTLTQQGCESLIDTTPDHWSDLQFGMAVDGGGGPALVRTGPNTLASAAPASAFEVRATVLAAQTNSTQEWVTELAAAVALAPTAASSWPSHTAYWGGFWNRSWIAVNMTNATSTASSSWSSYASSADAAHAPRAEAFAASNKGAQASALPVPGAVLWTRASSLNGQVNGTRVSQWRDESGASNSLAQSTNAAQPQYLANAFGAGAPGLVFDGQGTFLQADSLSLGTQATYFAVFRDDGSSGGNEGTPCCSGVIYLQGGDNGLSTVPATSSTSDDDAGEQDQAATADSPMVVLLDFNGRSGLGRMNVLHRPVVASGVYRANDSSLYVDGCLQTSFPSGASAGKGVMVGSRNDERGRFFLGAIGEVIIYPRALNDTERAAVEQYLLAAWPAVPPKSSCPAPPSPGLQLSQMYALTRFVQAVQSRGTQWPIKFNGGAWISAVNDGNGTADYRDWGPSNWWQNTRLPYGAMLTAGDFEEFRVILDYYLNMEQLLSPRTQLYWGHDGMWTTETHHLSGAYTQTDYGCSRPTGYPVSLETSGYLHLDHGGDSGTGEWSLMALDYLSWTGNASAAAQYLKLPFQAAEYFMNHFQNTTEDGRIIVWPAQVLETYWCDFDASSGTYSNCCADDTPTLSAMMGLFPRLLQLPESLTTPQQRAAWTQFLQARMPQLPLNPDGTFAPARVLSSGSHNNEGPELYPVHPHRVFTAGAAIASKLNISAAVATLEASAFSRENSGWNYGLNAAALLGVTEQAAAQLLERAASPPAAGYRFPAFAPHYQDFDPSADHFANMNRCLQEMLLQSGENGLSNASIVLFPAWPCQWDVQARLWGPGNTSVDIDYAGGQLRSLVVNPPERAGSVMWANCVSQ